LCPYAKKQAPGYGFWHPARLDHLSENGTVMRRYPAPPRYQEIQKTPQYCVPLAVGKVPVIGKKFKKACFTTGRKKHDFAHSSL